MNIELQDKINAIKNARGLVAQCNRMITKAENGESKGPDAASIFVVLKCRVTKELKANINGIRKDSYYGNIVASLSTNSIATDLEYFLRQRIDSKYLKIKIYQL